MPREKDFDKNEVINKCIVLFSKKGFNATGIRDIVNTTGVNRSSLYSTFKDKNDLFFICLSTASSNEINKLNLMKEKSGIDNFIDNYLQHSCSDQPVHHLFKFAHAEYKMLNKKTQKHITSFNKEKHEILLDVIKRGQKKGSFHQKADAKHLAIMLDVMTSGIQSFGYTDDVVYKKSFREFSSLIKKKSK